MFQMTSRFLPDNFIKNGRFLPCYSSIPVLPDNFKTIRNNSVYLARSSAELKHLEIPEYLEDSERKSNHVKIFLSNASFSPGHAFDAKDCVAMRNLRKANKN